MSVTSTRTTCAYCGVGCGVIARGTDDGRISIEGDKAHPSNFGRLCSKGSALGETLSLDDRLLFPQVGGEQASWDQALDTVSDRLSALVREHGPDSVAFYVSGQLLTEDYYVANKLMKGFIGSANIDTNSRLCMSSAVAGHKRAFGTDTVPACYEDLELADLIVLTGSNTAWCHPVVYQRIHQARDNGTRIVVIDPRRTATCDNADIHLALKPGTDVILFNGLLNYLRTHDGIDWNFLEHHTEGFAEALGSVSDDDSPVERVAEECELPEALVEQFYSAFASTPRVVTLFSQGINQSTAGSDKVNSILNCHLLSGRIGKPGCGPFSITGQPNAMGGREVGGLSNQLAAHMELGNADDVDRVARFWKTDRLASRPGYMAVDLFRKLHDGSVRALWVMATNPAVSLPDAGLVREAMKRCELVIVSDCEARTDTIENADVLLPALAWGEKDGTMTNSERRISRQRGFLGAPGEARADWWIITEVARRMGFGEHFDYTCAADIFREHARLSGFENNGTRDFDISRLAAISNQEYDALEPVQWPIDPLSGESRSRMFEDGRFYTPSGKARFVPIRYRPPENVPDQQYPLVLNTGRVRDQWHTMTRSGRSARLCAHLPEPFVEIHPVDARSWHLQDGSLARLSSRWGRMVCRVKLTEDQRPGSLFVPMHWNDQFASNACVDTLVNPATDPLSGQPECKHTPVNIKPYQAEWHGFILSRAQVDCDAADFRVRIRGQNFWRTEMAGDRPIENAAAWARKVIGSEGDWLDFEDPATRRFRTANIVDGRLQAVLFKAPTHELPARDWLAQLFAADQLDDSARMSLLAGKPARGQKDAGATVCACFGVGINTLREAILEHRLDSVDAIGEKLKAGTNCGSCIPELRSLLSAEKRET